MELLKLGVELIFKQVLDVQLIDKLLAIGLGTEDRKFAVVDIRLQVIYETLGMENMLAIFQGNHFILGEHFQAYFTVELIQTILLIRTPQSAL